MIFQRLNRTDPERIFMVMRSNESCSADDAVCLETNSDSIDGVKVRQPDTGLLHSFVGIADAAITSGSYGLIQVYGYRSTSRVFMTNTSIDTGVVITPVAGAAYVQSFASSNVPYGVLLETIVSSAASGTVSRKIFIRAM
jgi:hypothetical protein